MREVMGLRQRHRLIDQATLLRAVGEDRLEHFRAAYGRSLAARIEQGCREREPRWTESLAVGSEVFIKAMCVQWEQRRRLRVECAEVHGGLEMWTVRDSAGAYSLFSGQKIACKAL